MRAATILFAAELAALLAFGLPPSQEPPKPSLTLPCRVESVYDGDTATVTLKLKCRVRLKDINAPELRDPGGKESRDYLKSLAEGKDGVLHVPFEDAKNVGQVFSFDRAVGEIWIDGENVNDLLIEAGHATKVRQ